MLPSAGDLRGDTDCGGNVDSIDALQVLRTAAGLGSAAQCIGAAGDTDCDADVDSTDALRILRHVAQLSVTTPVGCSELGMPVELGPTSGELIDAALAAGEIDDDEAFLYRVFAAFGDSRLPVEYRGAPAGVDGVSALLRDAGDPDTLSPDVRETVAPFLLPPTAPESWMSASPTARTSAAGVEWDSLSGDHVKVWWHVDRREDADKAAAVLAELEGTIWPAVVDLMGRAPLSDAAQANGGGDELYDVYFAHIDASMLGYVSPMSGCEQTPSFMVLNSTRPLTPELFSTVAHEFMHAIQFTYDVGSCPDYRWLFESTAMWAEHYVYPDLNAEHAYAPAFLATLSEPLENFAYLDERPSGTYLFFLYLHHNFQYPEIVRDTWNHSGNTDSLLAVQAATSGLGGFPELWPEFSLFNWNHDTIDDYRDWDDMSSTAPFNSTFVSVSGSGATHFPVADTLKHLSARHQHFFFDESVRSVTFMNPFAGMGDPSLKVQALIRDEEGGWREVEDWTDKERVHFCRDKAGENIGELVLILSNSEFSDRTEMVDPAGQAEVVASGTGCEGWVGSATGVFRSVGPHRDETINVYANDVRFEAVPHPDENLAVFNLVEGSVRWTISGQSSEGCTVSGEMMLDPPGSGTQAAARGFFVVDRISGTYNLGISGSNPDATYDVNCEDGDGTAPWQVLYALFDGNQEQFVSGAPGSRQANGEFTIAEDDGSAQWSWQFSEVD